MKKKALYMTAGIIAVLAAVGFYFAPMQLNNIVSEQLNLAEADNLCVRVYSSPHLEKVYEIKDKEKINTLGEVFKDVAVRRVVTLPDIFRPLMYETYYLILIKGNKALSIDFMDEDYLVINSHIYRIVDKPDLKIIYDTVVSSQ